MDIEKVVRAGDTVKLSQGERTFSYEIIRTTKSHTWAFGWSGGLTYTLKENQISDSSPLGKALLGHPVGDTVMGYRIEEIVRGNEYIPHTEDIELERLTELETHLQPLYEQLSRGEWVEASLIGYKNRLYPVRKSESALHPLYTELRGKKLLSGLSITNTDLEDSGLIQICLNLSTRLSDSDDINARAEMIVSPATIESLRLKPCPSGKRYRLKSAYSIMDSDAEAAFQPPKLLARIDPNTKQFSCRIKNGQLEDFYLCLTEDSVL